MRRLRERPPTLWYGGRLVEDATAHPALRAGAATLAALYDLQWQHADVCLYDSPTSGAKVARSFMLPTTVAEVSGIGRALRISAEHTHGMMGRAAGLLEPRDHGVRGGGAFSREPSMHALGRTPARYYERVRENDLCLTHTLISPQANRAVGAAKQSDPYLAARVHEETDAGLVIRGCRMLATLPLSDEILVLPSTVLKGDRRRCTLRLRLRDSERYPGLAIPLP